MPAQAPTDEKTYGATSWAIEDVIQAFSERGRRISPQNAEEWLEDNEDHIREAMIAAGWVAMDALICKA